MKETVIDVEGGDAFERAKRMLSAADIDPDEVDSVYVEVSHGVEVDIGPVESEATGHSKGGAGQYDGAYDPVTFEGVAIRPDSIQGQVLDWLNSHDEWFHRDNIDVDATNTQVADALSKLLTEKGYVKRRKMDPQPNRRGVQREYRITKEGGTAIEEGKRRAKNIDD